MGGRNCTMCKELEAREGAYRRLLECAGDLRTTRQSVQALGAIAVYVTPPARCAAWDVSRAYAACAWR